MTPPPNTDWTQPNDVLAARLGVRPETVSRYRQKHGIPLPKRRKGTGRPRKLPASEPPINYTAHAHE